MKKTACIGNRTPQWFEGIRHGLSGIVFNPVLSGCFLWMINFDVFLMETAIGWKQVECVSKTGLDLISKRFKAKGSRPQEIVFTLNGLRRS